MLHYVVTLQACLYNDMEQWLHQLLEYDRISESNVHIFKTMQEQVSTQSLSSGVRSMLSNHDYYLFTDQFDEANICKEPCRYRICLSLYVQKKLNRLKLAERRTFFKSGLQLFAAWSLMQHVIVRQHCYQDLIAGRQSVNY